MPPLTQTLGPWLEPEARAPRRGNTHLSRQKQLIGALADQLPARRRVVLTLDSENIYLLPYRWLGFRYEPTFSYRIPCLSDGDRVRAQLHPGAAKGIRRALGRVEVTQEEDGAVLLEVLEQVFRRQGRPCPWPAALVRRVAQGSMACGRGRLFTARDGRGRVHACSLLVYDAARAYTLLGGCTDLGRASGAKYAVVDAQLRFAAGVSRAFDFAGSNLEGVEQFVRRFGGEPVVNYRVLRQSLARDVLELARPRVKRLLGWRM